MNVPYKLAEGGGAILVPASVVHDTRLKLASQGLPKGGDVGFELVDNQKFGATQFQEQINYQRGLEGELANSIQSLVGRPGCARAPRDPQAVGVPARAARAVGVGAGDPVSRQRLDRAQVTGIVHLVASSVPSLPLDQRQHRRPERDAALQRARCGRDGLDPTQLSYVQQIEQNTASASWTSSSRSSAATMRGSR